MRCPGWSIQKVRPRCTDASSIVTTIIYMPLLDEGTAVYRPVQAEHIDGDSYRVVGPRPPDERWAFEPGVAVRCVWQPLQSGLLSLVAIESVDAENSVEHEEPM